MPRRDWSDLPIGPLIIGMLLAVVLVTFILAFTLAGDGGSSATPTPTAPAASPTATATAQWPLLGASWPLQEGPPRGRASGGQQQVHPLRRRRCEHPVEGAKRGPQERVACVEDAELRNRIPEVPGREHDLGCALPCVLAVLQ